MKSVSDCFYCLLQENSPVYFKQTDSNYYAWLRKVNSKCAFSRSSLSPFSPDMLTRLCEDKKWTICRSEYGGTS